MEWAKQAEHIFRTWTDVQKNLWDDWLKGVQGLANAHPADVWVKTAEAWEDSVKKTLDAQVQWTQLWVDSIASVQGTPQEKAEWAHQGQAMMQRWIDTQRQLWDGWFQVVKRLSPSLAGESWDREGQQFLQAWQEAIQKALDAQVNWVHFWSMGQARKTSEE